MQKLARQLRITSELGSKYAFGSELSIRLLDWQDILRSLRCLEVNMRDEWDKRCPTAEDKARDLYGIFKDFERLERL